MDDMQPGQLIVPHSSGDSKPPGNGPPEPVRPTEQPEPVPQPTPPPEPSAPATTNEAAPAVLAAPAAEPTTNWQFQEEAETAPADNREPLPTEGLSWTASEFIAHEKGTGWYGLLALGSVVAATLVYLVTKDYISTGVVILAAAMFGFFASRKPSTQQYSLSVHGLQIGQKFYDFQGFKTFSIGEEGAIASIVFTPLKRFMPPLTIYVAPDIEEKVVDFLSAFLPFEQHKADAVDSLLKRIRF